MPASEFAWAGEARLPIFQMYGTKRKAPQENDQHWMPNSLQPNEPNAAKRACLWGSGDVQDDTSMCTDMGMENNNTLILHPQQQLQQQQHPVSHENITAWPSPHLAAQSQQPPVQPTQHVQQGGVMDLCGETFSTSTTAETDEALMAMDSDFTPNPEQYRSAETTQDRTGMNVPDMRSAFCNDYCGVGERSPTSSCVRCFCKPSWEGMMTMRPYISDIY